MQNIREQKQSKKRQQRIAIFDSRSETEKQAVQKLTIFLSFIDRIDGGYDGWSRNELCLHFGTILGKRIDLLLKSRTYVDNIVDILNNPQYLIGGKTYCKFNRYLNLEEQEVLDNTTSEDLWIGYNRLIHEYEICNDKELKIEIEYLLGIDDV